MCISTLTRGHLGRAPRADSAPFSDGEWHALALASCTVVSRGDGFDPAPLVHPEEMAMLGEATERRRREFSLGRACARLALHSAGGPTTATILRGGGGEPLWPTGFLGSISHTVGAAAAVVAPAARALGLGIDIETRDHTLSPIALERICRASDLDFVEQGDGRLRATLLFSAKESVWKAVYSFTGMALSLADIAIQWSQAADRFLAEVPLAPGARHSPSVIIYGRARTTGRLLATLAVIEPVSFIHP
jgi:4'-phosphopantetheinyl transferase EntD